MNSTELSTKEVVGPVLLVLISEIKVKFFNIIILYNKMSDYQRPFNGVVPELVSDVNLKRARVETSDGGSAIRVTSTAADLAPITDALGTQQDPMETPTVIGLLKNLIANSGGGGSGGSTTLSVPRIQIYDPLYNNNWGTIQQIYFYDNSTQVYDFPEWADYIGFFSMQSGNLGVCKLKDNAAYKTIILEINDFAYPADPGAGTSLQLYKEYAKIEFEEITGTPSAPLSATFNGWREDWSSSTPTVTQYTDRDYGSFIPFVFSLSSFDISGGGGGNEAISTYSFTLNNVNTTAITAPVSDPASDDDKTLVSLGYLKDLINNAHLQRRQLILTGQLTQLDTGTGYDIESTFNITIPSWANRLRIGYQIATFGTTQNFIEFGTPGGTFSTFSINNGTGTLFGVNLTYANKTLTINRVMSLTPGDDDWTTNTNKFGLISITAYGSFSF